MPDIEQLLKSAPIPDSVRADAWDAWHAAAGPQDLAARLQRLPIDNETKANLWDAKNTATPPVDMRPRNVGTTPDAPAESQGMLRSFYEGAIRPVVDQITDSYKRGDFGEHAATELLSSFKDQLRNFAGHPDIRNTPIVGPGATATAAKMQKQYDAGNYTGMLGTAAGFVAPFAAPAAIEAAPEAAAAVKSGAQALRDKLPDTIPTVPGAVADAVGIVHPGAAFAIRAANKVATIANKLLDSKKTPAVPLTPTEQALADMRASAAAQAAQDAAYERLPGTPREPAPPNPSPAAQPAAEAVPPAAAAHVSDLPAPDQYTATAEDFAPGNVWEPGPPGTPETWAPFTPDARASLPPELVAKVDALRAATHPPIADARAAQLVEDAADEQAAQLQHQAEDITWANRARRADRFAQYLTENKLDPTPANLTKAAKALAEKGGPPSAETADMIADRMGYKPADAAKPTDLETLLQKSLDAFNAAKARKGK
jgi:hypothetical protein